MIIDYDLLKLDKLTSITFFDWDIDSVTIGILESFIHRSESLSLKRVRVDFNYALSQGCVKQLRDFLRHGSVRTFNIFTSDMGNDSLLINLL